MLVRNIVHNHPYSSFFYKIEGNFQGAVDIKGRNNKLFERCNNQCVNVGFFPCTLSASEKPILTFSKTDNLRNYEHYSIGEYVLKNYQCYGACGDLNRWLGNSFDNCSARAQSKLNNARTRGHFNFYEDTFDDPFEAGPSFIFSPLDCFDFWHHAQNSLEKNRYIYEEVCNSSTYHVNVVDRRISQEYRNIYYLPMYFGSSFDIDLVVGNDLDNQFFEGNYIVSFYYLPVNKFNEYKLNDDNTDDDYKIQCKPCDDQNAWYQRPCFYDMYYPRFGNSVLLAKVLFYNGQIYLLNKFSIVNGDVVLAYPVFDTFEVYDAIGFFNEGVLNEFNYNHFNLESGYNGCFFYCDFSEFNGDVIMADCTCFEDLIDSIDNLADTLASQSNSITSAVEGLGTLSSIYNAINNLQLSPTINNNVPVPSVTVEPCSPQIQVNATAPVVNNNVPVPTVNNNIPVPSVTVEPCSPQIQVNATAPVVQNNVPVPSVTVEPCSPQIQVNATAPVVNNNVPVPTVNNNIPVPSVTVEPCSPQIQVNATAPVVQNNVPVPSVTNEITTASGSTNYVIQNNVPVPSVTNNIPVPSVTVQNNVPVPSITVNEQNYTNILNAMSESLIEVKEAVASFSVDVNLIDSDLYKNLTMHAFSYKNVNREIEDNN